MIRIFNLIKKIFTKPVFVATVSLLVIWAFVYFSMPGNPQQRPSTRIKIPHGATFRQAVDSLEAHNLVKHRTWFLLMGRIFGGERKVRAGMFDIPRGLNSYQLIKYLPAAKNIPIKVTIPEGLELEEIAAIFRRKMGVDSSRFIRLTRDSAFIRRLGIADSSLQGYLLPETYFLGWQTPDSEIIRRMVKSTLKIFQRDSIRRRMRETGMSMKEALTLASIIEGEAVVDSERVLISSVYHNRLKRGWRLEADPTIQFIVPGPPRRLTFKDLANPSPYNTYKYAGLPPGPINNPGEKSILAALFPAQTRYLYFVATGNGGHHFSATLREHLRWKQKFDAVRRKVARQRRR